MENGLFIHDTEQISISWYFGIIMKADTLSTKIVITHFRVTNYPASSRLTTVPKDRSFHNRARSR